MQPPETPTVVPDYTTKPLSPETWPAFAALIERHNGVWGGCWCVEFHPEGKLRGPHRRELKERKVHNGSTHAALVFDGDRCIGWCQFGTPMELPRIRHHCAYTRELDVLPDWRITCFFVDKQYRGRGVAAAALAGALRLIADAGGGIVESYPQDVQGREVSASFLYNSGVAMFERQGFARTRPLGKNHWVMRKVVSNIIDSNKTPLNMGERPI